jgi:hypothetical protein
MKALTEVQVEDLASYIQASVERYEPLQEELLDHLACIVEKKLAEGLDYPTAKKQALSCLPKDEVKKTEGRTLYFIHTKPMLMKCFMFFSISCLLGLSSLIFSNPDDLVEAESVENNSTASLQDTPPDGSPIHVLAYEPPSIAPLADELSVTSDFGMRVHPISKTKRMHIGIDLKAPLGTPILATGDGIIKESGDKGDYGLRIIIQHDEHYESRYAHLSELKVKVGETIKKGTVIGLVGNTGVSMQAHLHYEVFKDGKPVNPADFLPTP